jgi:hypothetical protein
MPGSVFAEPHRWIFTVIQQPAYNFADHPTIRLLVDKVGEIPYL